MIHGFIIPYRSRKVHVISLLLDYSDTTVYNESERGDPMESFMKQEFSVLKIANVCFVPSGGGAPVHNNRPTHGLVLYTGGECCFAFPTRKIHVKKNDIIYLPKYSCYTVQTLQTESGCGCYAVNFDFTEETDFAPFSLNVKNTGSFLAQFKHTELLWRLKKSGYHIDCMADLYGILCALRREYELGYLPRSSAEQLQPAITYIHEHYTEESIRISDLAERCFISESYFRILFRKAHGISPVKYINDLRISRARELIASGMYSISEAAAMSGFHDDSYFSREFRKATGFSPSEYGCKGFS